MPTRPVKVGRLEAGPVETVTLGGNGFAVIAGPCSIDTAETFRETAEAVRSAGAALLRGAVFKLRTDPASFQGLGLSARELVHEVRTKTRMPIVTEVTDPRQIGSLLEIVDMFQVGSRNMHNYELLKELGRLKVPVLLKRGLSAFVEEWLLAAQYIENGGNSNIVLCERGIRTFEKVTRNTLDLSAVAYAKENSPYPVFVDPSHGTGVPSLIPRMCLAAAAVGADGLMLEVHPAPHSALSDGYQALTPTVFRSVIQKLEPLLNCLGRPLLTVGGIA